MKKDDKVKAIAGAAIMLLALLLLIDYIGGYASTSNDIKLGQVIDKEHRITQASGGAKTDEDYILKTSVDSYAIEVGVSKSNFEYIKVGDKILVSRIRGLVTGMRYGWKFKGKFEGKVEE